MTLNKEKPFLVADRKLLEDCAKCYLCKNILRDPRSLLCQHNYCFWPCLESLIKDEKILCKCGSTQNIPEGGLKALDVLHILLPLIQLLSETYKEKKYCVECNEELPQMPIYCYHCQKEICSDCYHKEHKILLPYMLVRCKTGAYDCGLCMHEKDNVGRFYFHGLLDGSYIIGDREKRRKHEIEVMEKQIGRKGLKNAGLELREYKLKPKVSKDQSGKQHKKKNVKHETTTFISSSDGKTSMFTKETQERLAGHSIEDFLALSRHIEPIKALFEPLAQDTSINKDMPIDAYINKMVREKERMEAQRNKMHKKMHIHKHLHHKLRIHSTELRVQSSDDTDSSDSSKISPKKACSKNKKKNVDDIHICECPGCHKKTLVEKEKAAEVNPKEPLNPEGVD